MSFLFASCVHISQHHNLVSCSIELPSTEDQNVRANRSCRMTISAQWRLSLESSLFPYKFIICIQHNKVINIRRRNEVLLTSSAWIDAPTSKKYDVRSTDVCCMSIPWKRRRSWHSDSSPFVFLSIQNSNVIQITSLQLSSLSEASLLLDILIKIETSLNDHVSSNLNGCMTMSRWG